MKTYKDIVTSLKESSGGQGKVETKKYSWGTMKTVHHGADFSIPLHPEHHHAISKLKDEQEHKFKDETGRHWVARRKGEHVHFDTTGNGSMKTHVPMHTMKEEYENVELDEETHSELARQAAGKYRSALARGDSVAAAAANAEHIRHRKAAELARKKSHVPGIEEGVEIVQEGSDYKVTIDHHVRDGDKVTTTKHDYVIKNALSRKHAKHIAMNKHSDKVGPLKSGHSFGTAAQAPVELKEGKMGQIHADIEDHLGKHLADYKANGGAEHFANKVMKTHEHIAKLHGLEQKHAAKLVNSYVDSKLNEAAYAGLEKEDKPGKKKTEFKGGANSVSGETVEGWKDEKKIVKEAVVQDLDKYFDKIGMKGSEEKKSVVKKEPENTIKGSQVKFFNTFKEDMDINEKLNLAKSTMGDVVKDFQKSDAPQFAGKSKEKRQQMAVAAKLQADRQQNEGVIQPTGDDSIDTGADNKGKTTYTKDKSGKLVSFKYEGEWKKATKKDPRGKVTHMSDVAQRQAAKMANEEVVMEETDPQVHVYHRTSDGKGNWTSKHIGTMKLSDANKKHETQVTADHVGKSSHGIDTSHGARNRAPFNTPHDAKRLRYVHASNSINEEVELEEGYDKSSEHHKAARSMAREHGGKATFNADGTAHVRFNDAVTGRSTVNPSGTLLHTGSEAASRAAKDHGKGKVDGNTVHFKEHAPVAPVPDRKYIKGTPEWKAHKEKSKPINGHPTNVKEEVELEEAFINGREYASQGVMHPDHAKIHKVGNQTDFYAHGTGDKISGKVTHNDGKEVHFKADKTSGGATHKFKVSSTLPKPVNEESDHDPYFTAQKHKSDAEKAHKAGDHKSYHMFMAAHHDSMAEWSAKRGRHHVAAQHEGKAQNHEDWANQTHKEEVSIDDEGNFVVEKLSYEQFMSQLLEYTPGPGGVTRVQGRSYGAQYHDPEGDDDADDKPAKKAEPTAKRGRGRPAGSKSGANVKRLSSKGSNGYGYDSTGYKLHLPNSNK